MEDFIFCAVQLLNSDIAHILREKMDSLVKKEMRENPDLRVLPGVPVAQTNRYVDILRCFGKLVIHRSSCK